MKRRLAMLGLVLGLLLLSPGQGTVGRWTDELGVEAATSTSLLLPNFTLRCTEDVGLLTTTAVIRWDPVPAPAPLFFSATVESASPPTVVGDSVRIEPSLFSVLFGAKKRVTVIGTLPQTPGSGEFTKWRTVAETNVFVSLAGTRVTCA